ncbi:hypothetical protein A1O3_00992 [Capronia epimyces CBS 606.96]|uniref:Uncharacterized protein n=1 Tax=Capronia epimyces CBS 606.96 TaxID=1182542 RepID=W9YT67_9EURO|nr:uncharacterized protein A1O3_00992 [Capronia epimyces CBS 606.96]EXJ92441.1 hypothetical protein A1O3_00992 [Capronia epimyces CBS 606.96]
MHMGRSGHEESLEIGKFPIIFVAHSMGGLVVKKAYLLGQNDQAYREMFGSISGMVFLATPHRGSNLASTLSLILELLLQSKKRFIAALQEHSAAIEELNEQFRHVARRLDIISFYEECQTRIVAKSCMIVEKDSSILGYSEEKLRGLNADHQGVCKFDSEVDPNYKIVRDSLKSLVEKFGHNGRAPSHSGHPSTTSEELKKLLGIPDPPYEDLSTLLKRRAPKSCKWLLKEPTAREWLTDQSESCVLWYNAPPAAGKSVLSSFLVDYLQSEGYEYQYHFFNADDQGKRSVSNMLKSLACQVSSVLHEYRIQLQSVLSEGLPLEKSDHRLIWQKLFESTLFGISSKRPLFWVIDAVDESESPKTVVGLLQEVLQKSQTKIKIFLTSRRTDALALCFDKLQRVGKVYTIDGEIQQYNQQDIQLLLASEMEYLPGSEELKQQLGPNILQRAKGNFLWVSLVLEELHTCQTEKDIQDTLQKLPDDMTKMYQRMEDAITQTSNKQNVELARLLLQWVICTPRPLTLGELEDALRGDHTDILNLRSTIRSLCGQFVLIDQTDHVTMIHQTAREYLTTVSQSAIAIDHQHAHNTLLVKTLSSLSASSPSSNLSLLKLDDLQKKKPFILYAATSWIYHLRHVDRLSDQVIDKLVDFFSQSFVLDWIHLLARRKQLTILVKGARELITFVDGNRKLNVARNPMLHRLSALELLEGWTVDLVRITGKFSRQLLLEPRAIYEIIPALCPTTSVIHQRFNRGQTTKLRVSGANESWTDAFARLSLPHDEPAVKIACAGQRVAVLSQSGTIYMWSSVDFQEVCTLRHQEPVTDICFNSRSDLLVSAGLSSTIVWKIPTGQILLQTPNPNGSRVLSIAFSDRDRRILTASDDRVVRLLRIDESMPTWKVVNTNLLREKNETTSAFINTPKCLKINPGGTQVAVSYRSFPLSAWDLDSGQLIARCVRPHTFPDLDSDPSSTWSPVDSFTWNPVTGHIIGIYKDKTLFKWHPVSSAYYEVGASADEVAASPDGTLFVTSDTNGMVKVWNFAYFSPIYQLTSGDLVSGLSFSPDSTRFYDIRGPTITAWEPNGMLRLAESGETFSDTASDNQSGTLNSHLSQAVAPEFSSLTALAAAPTGPRYVMGNEDGEVYLSDGRSSSVCELTKFHNFFGISHLAWAPSRDLVAAADLGGDIRILQLQVNTADMDIAGRDGIRLLPNPETKLGDRTVHQLLIDASSRKLLVISDDFAQVWHVAETESAVTATAKMDHATERGWLNHPSQQEAIIAIGPENIQVFHWDDLRLLCQYRVGSEAFSFARQPTLNLEGGGSTVIDTIPRDTRRPTWHPDSESTVYRSMLTQDRQHMMAHVKEQLAQGKVQKRLLIVATSAIAMDIRQACEPGLLRPVPYLRIPSEVAEKIELPLGILAGALLVFFDRDLWVCSISLSPRPDPGSFKRHYFVPRDWMSRENFEQCCMLDDGTLLCPREGDVVRVRSNLREIYHYQ